MSLLAAWVLYPLILLALCVGVGLLVDVLCGRRLPGALLAPTGLAAIVVAGGFTTLSGPTAPLTTPIVVVLALLGTGLSLRSWRFGRPDPWPVVVALGVFLVFGAPVILSGDPTFAGYVKLDDTATWLAITDRVMEHGRDLGGLAPSSYHATLEANLPGGYPVGAFVPFGAAQRIAGGDLAWVFQPYLSFLAAMLSLAIWEILGMVRRPPLRAGAAFIAAQPALLYGYAMWGGVKELAAAAFVALAAALAPMALRGAWGAADFHPTPVGSNSDASTVLRLRDVAPLALAAAALVGVLSLGGLVWVAPLLVALAVLGWRRLGEREVARRALALGAVLLLLVAPTLIAGGFDPFQSGLTSESELGNLAGPLSGFQVVGIWPAGDFRADPDSSILTALLVALALAAALLGLWSAWLRRAARPLLYATALLACAAIVVVGSPWVGGKGLATAAPVVLTLAALGGLAALRLDRLAGGALIVVLAGGVLWSNVLAYGGVNLAPYGLLHELEQVGEELAGEGPTLMTEYNPYGARHFLREADGEGASELRNRQIPLRGGGEAEKGEAVDTDRIEASALFGYRTLVLRRGPLSSRPPLPYRLVRHGEYYDVWQRGAKAAPPAAFLPLGAEARPAAVPACGEVLALARRARAAGATGLTAARRAPDVDATSGEFELPRPGRYTAWLGGSVRGSVALYIDGREIGEARQRIENQGGFIELGTTALAAGPHGAELRFGGADLHPGSGGFPRPASGPLLFTPAGAEAGSLVSVPLTEATRLCGREWDWIEAAVR
jgi:hypothetical protein